MDKISVVLNGYKRPETLAIQLEALHQQSITPHEILIWQNSSEDGQGFMPMNHKLHDYPSAVSNVNWGVWARFAYALNTTGDYICLFDDDTIPGHRWLENCLNESKEQRGIYGTIGVIFKDLDYSQYIRHGWAAPNEETKMVDIVGHSWFFDREMLGAFWREGQVPFHNLSGEDVHLSYAVQKYLGLNTYVPPHPLEDTSLWGSQKESAMAFGVDDVAISCNYHGSHFGQNLKNYWDKGFDYLMLGKKTKEETKEETIEWPAQQEY